MLFEEEINNDIIKTQLMLNRDKDKNISESEKKAIDIFKRTLTVIDYGGLSVSDDRKVVSGSDNKLPVSSYLAHGSRVMIQIPPVNDDNNPHEFMNWLISGDKSKIFIDNDSKNQKNPLFNRLISSHSTHLKSIEGNKIFLEDKGVLVGALDAIKGLSSSKELGNHFGLNLAFNKDNSGLDLVSPDGEHGHMYMHYRSPSKDAPGSLMIGVENSAPGKANHSLMGTPNTTTHIGGAKWNSMLKKYKQNDVVTDIVIPRVLNGMRVDLDSTNYSKLISNNIKFDESCLTNPPKVSGNTKNLELINKMKDSRREEKVINLKNLFLEKSSGKILLDSTLMSPINLTNKDFSQRLR